MLWGLESYVEGNLVLLHKYFEHLVLLRGLPQTIQNPDDFVERLAKHDREVMSKHTDDTTFEIEVDDGSIATNFNNSIEDIKAKMRSFDLSTRTIPFVNTIALMFGLRLLCLATALFSPDPLRHTFLVSLLQFVIAPYSAFVSVTMLMALFPPLFLGHYLVYGFFACVIPSWLTVPFTINNWFVVTFMLVDQALCLKCAFVTSLGKSVWFGWRKTLIHAAYGMINSKSYTLLILLLLRGQTFSLTAWVLDVVFCISPRVTRWATSTITMHWAVLFYNQHRMSHLPRVYEHAHKFHHYLCDTNAFDAHVYGSGMPEEFLCMWGEVLFALLRPVPLLPTTLGYHTLLASYSNKVGHSRKLDESGGVNHHADHHTIHSKNFAIYNCLMDMYFGTNHPNNERFCFANYIVEKKTRQDAAGNTQVVFLFTRVDSMLPFQEMQDKYYSPSLLKFLQGTMKLLLPKAK